MTQSGDDESNERSSPRAPIELKVAYEKLNTFFADYTKNISRGGTFIKTSKPLDIGTQFMFRLQVPGLEEPLSLRGEVRWMHREGEVPPEGIPEDHAPGMGIRFLFRDDDERQRVADVVEDLMIGSLGQLIYSKLMGKGQQGS